MIKKIKISKLPLVSSFTGLFTIGVDKDNKSVKIGLEFIKTAADNCDEKAKLADEKAAAAAANQAAGTASNEAANAGMQASAAEQAAQETTEVKEQALATIARLEELEESLVGQYKMIPTGMNLTYPKVITLRNPASLRIAYELLPTSANLSTAEGLFLTARWKTLTTVSPFPITCPSRSIFDQRQKQQKST